jgi:hypothetical protein
MVEVSECDNNRITEIILSAAEQSIRKTSENTIRKHQSTFSSLVVQ